jgi:hypothetical protein
MADRGSFDEFYAGAVGRLVGQLVPVTGDLHEAEEVVQEAFTRAAARWSRLCDYDVPEAWVRRVAMNLVTDRARNLRRPGQSHAQAPSATRGPAGLDRGARAGRRAAYPADPAAPGAGPPLPGRPAGRGGRPHAGHAPTALSRACCPAVAMRWRPSSVRPRRCSTRHERPAGTTAGTGRCRNPPQPHPRPRGGEAPRPPSAATAVRRHGHGGRPGLGGRSGRHRLAQRPAHPTHPGPDGGPHLEVRPADHIHPCSPEMDPVGHPAKGQGTTWAVSGARPWRHRPRRDQPWSAGAGTGLVFFSGHGPRERSG